MRLPNLPPAVIYGEGGTAHKPHPDHPGAARRPEMTMKSSQGSILPPAKKVRRYQRHVLNDNRPDYV
jgi:hypothetical protein